jgi:hypothetical protein
VCECVSGWGGRGTATVASVFSKFNPALYVKGILGGWGREGERFHFTQLRNQVWRQNCLPGLPCYLESSFTPCGLSPTLQSARCMNCAEWHSSSLSAVSTVYSCWKWTLQMWDSCLYLTARSPGDAGGLWQRHCSLRGIHLKDFPNQGQMCPYNSRFSEDSSCWTNRFSLRYMR